MEFPATTGAIAELGRLEDFLLELGDDFAFLGRQRRLRIDDEWYRIDLLFFHRRLKALIIIDLKVGKFTHADAGQMHEKCLAHEQRGVRAIYNKAEYADQRRQLLQSWADMVDGWIRGGDVVPLRRVA
jgi:hypothetical protein